MAPVRRERGANAQYQGPETEIKAMYRRADIVLHYLRRKYLDRVALYDFLRARRVHQNGIRLSVAAQELRVWQEAIRHAEWLEHFFAHARAMERQGEGFEPRAPKEGRPAERRCRRCRRKYLATTRYFKRHRGWLRAVCKECDHQAYEDHKAEQAEGKEIA